jgi:hypothetical protein
MNLGACTQKGMLPGVEKFAQLRRSFFKIHHYAPLWKADSSGLAFIIWQAQKESDENSVMAFLCIADGRPSPPLSTEPPTVYLECPKPANLIGL